MTKPAAKEGDLVLAIDTHVVLAPSPAGPAPTPLPHPFVGKLDGELSPDVKIEHRFAAVLGSTATNAPEHVPLAGSFQREPTNRGTVVGGSARVLINNKPAVRIGDAASTCNDPADQNAGIVICTSTVLIAD
jgi:uncharacterized Zn-binding protein involved in type VI secretion